MERDLRSEAQTSGVLTDQRSVIGLRPHLTSSSQSLCTAPLSLCDRTAHLVVESYLRLALSA